MSSTCATASPMACLPLDCDERERWVAVIDAEWEAFCKRIDAGEETLIDPYGGEAVEEFFAVAVEAFFVAPAAMRTEEPAMYALLSGFFKQDPATLKKDAEASFHCHRPTGQAVAGSALGLLSLAGLGGVGWMSSTVSPLSSTSTLSRPPSTSLPNSSSSASARRMVSWIRRCIGRAPISGSNPFLARCLRSASEKLTSTFFSCQLAFELQQELVDDAQDDLLVQRPEGHDGIQAVAELGREQALDVGHLVALLARVGEADGGLVQRLGARIRRHDDDDVAEVRLAPVVVGQRAVVHDLQQHVEDIRMRLLDFVEQQHACGFFVTASVSRPPWSKPT